ncbi:MAG: transcriptional repressor LexA [Bacteriovoracaceae bacterium]|jgi:repressor LexA|nr:repressor LexA [Halobacteriovoraceae bacterium]MDP7319082.1 transcriptional repressor LexA [Bacteriovoracaceae bacterium]|tara:strand:- start:425 stop:1024 length:600 start_codon:yes stop_codon:yes gene_type:complete
MSLTKKQKQVYDYICQYIEEYEYSPTQVEIQEHFGFKSLGSVQDYIRYLKNSGHLENDPNSVRGLRPVQLNENSELIEIPLHGKVAAGNPIEAIEGTESVAVPASMLKSGNHFALTVSGESMIEDGILDGDLIIIKEKNYAQNGETVVATLNNEATVKRYYKKSKQIELHPANSSMSPIIVKNGDFQIKGILVGLYRSY